MLGIPASVEIEAVDVSATPAETRTGVRLVPVSTFETHDLGSQHSATQYWRESGSAYRSNVRKLSYPGLPLARVVREGYIRNQRVIALALYPVQYFPSTRQLRLYSHLTVNIRFSKAKQGAPFLGSQSQTKPYSIRRIVPESETFERALSHQLLNAEAARHFRPPRPAIPAAPGVISDGSDGIRYKLFVRETGIHAVTASVLQQNWGVELIGADPAKFRLTHQNRDIPIYISGAGDGRFDPEDYHLFPWA